MVDEEIKQIVLRRDKESEWSTANPILREGELALETTNRRLKLGDGSSAWDNLSFIESILHHNDMSLQGGATDEAYHLTEAEHTALTAGFTGTNELVRTDDPVVTDPTIGVPDSAPADANIGNSQMRVWIGGTYDDELNFRVRRADGTLATGTVQLS